MQMNNNMQMNKIWERLFPLVIALTVFWSGCADPTFVGSDLLNEDRVNAVFTDTLTIQSRTVRGDSVLTFSPNPIWLAGYLFGDYSDPIFGSTYSEIYAQPTLELSTISFLRPDFSNANLDSVVLVLPYHGDGFYGNTDQEFSMEVYELVDSMAADSVYYSSQKLAYNNLIGSKNFVPSLDSVTFIDYRTSSSPDTVSLAQLRVPLSMEFGNRILTADTSNFLTNSDFRKFFRGFALRPGKSTNGAVSFDLEPSGGNYDAGIYLYFRRDTVPVQYRFPVSFRSPVSAYMENDYSGTAVEPAINSSGFSDSLAYVQGTEGLLLELDFPNLAELENVIVNKAELLVPIAGLENDDPTVYPPAKQLYAYYYDQDTREGYVPVDDLLLGTPATIDIVFGGLVETGTGGNPDLYRLNISVWFQRMLEADRDSDIRNTIYLTVAPRGERLSRSILYGAEHPQFPIKLNLTYTTQ